MLNPETFAVHLARALELFRTTAPKEEQKQQFRILVGMLKDGGVLMSVAERHLVVNGTAIDLPQIEPLRERLGLHGVTELVVPHDTPVAHVYELLKALSDPPADAPLAERLKATGATRLSVTVRAVDPDVPPAPPPPPPPPPKEVFAAPAARVKSADEVLAELEREPTAASASDTLAVLARQVEIATRDDKIEEALRIVDGIIRIEESVPDRARRGYTIAVKRVLSKDLLEALGKLAGAQVHRDAALRVLGRGGYDGIEILLQQLANAPTVETRRDLFAALGRLKHGHEQLMEMLEHSQWFVVRNVAELLGELGLEASAPALSKQLAHPDERVRGAVALALAKIGTAGAVEPLRRALRDPTVAVRLQVALGVSGRKSSALAMPIVVAIEQEQDVEVVRELMLALGRIASPDAVQALIKFAQPGGKVFGRKPTASRLAAVEALRVAATPAAIGTLQGLAGDSEKEVKSAARAALAELKR